MDIKELNRVILPVPGTHVGLRKAVETGLSTAKNNAMEPAE